MVHLLRRAWLKYGGAGSGEDGFGDGFLEGVVGGGGGGVGQSDGDGDAEGEGAKEKSEEMARAAEAKVGFEVDAGRGLAGVGDGEAKRLGAWFASALR